MKHFRKYIKKGKEYLRNILQNLFFDLNALYVDPSQNTQFRILLIL